MRGGDARTTDAESSAGVTWASSAQMRQWDFWPDGASSPAFGAAITFDATSLCIDTGCPWVCARKLCQLSAKSSSARTASQPRDMRGSIPPLLPRLLNVPGPPMGSTSCKPSQIMICCNVLLINRLCPRCRAKKVARSNQKIAHDSGAPGIEIALRGWAAALRLSQAASLPTVADNVVLPYKDIFIS